MEEYIVKTLHLGGKGNKIYHAGDKVTQNQMSREVAELVKKGFLMPVKVAAPIAPAAPVEGPTKKEIIEQLRAKGVKVDTSLNKDELAKLLEKTLAAEVAGTETTETDDDTEDEL